jgi:deazaflavin-dependent oxidoreductase (nitroreductase family)
MDTHAHAAGRAPAAPAARVPLHVRLFSGILKAVVAAGVPMGYNGLITIRGRTSGQPRTAAVAIIPIGGSRWVWSPWGDVHWVKNLRAAGRATITVRRTEEEVTARELDAAQRVEFFRDVFAPFVRKIPFGVWFVRIVDGVNLNHPEDVATDRRVFELRPIH